VPRVSASRRTTRSQQIHEQLGHPVIDGDGHIIEMLPVFTDFLRDHGRGDIVDAAAIFNTVRRSMADEAGMTIAQRRSSALMPATWTIPTDTDYFATVTQPSRYYDRLGEAGIDFAVLYPTFGLPCLQIDDPDHRVTVCRLFNEWLAEEWRPYADRFTIAAAVPMHTPEEAIAGLEHAKSIGAKVALIPSWVRRPRNGDAFVADDLERIRPTGFGFRGWLDTFGLDSAHDYDPVWAKAIDLGLPLAVHSPGMGFDDRQSATSFTFNGVGHFAAAGVALAKSLFLGGVTRRFPQLRVAVLEGGVAVGVEAYVRLVGFWKKRGARGLDKLDPANLDYERLAELYAARDPRLAKYPARGLAAMVSNFSERYDDFAAAGIDSVADIRDQWCRAFTWGCEADDPLVGLAFDTRANPLGARLPAIMGSDIGHWDVPEFDSPLAEAYELVDDGILDEAQLREFLFTNSVALYGASNPGFFTGTVIERETAAARAES
jgi:predicted TIM-barrel fold metal-dependent hydrolase